MTSQEKLNFFANWLIFSIAFVIGVFVIVFVISPVTVWLLNGVWEVDTFDKYYRYLIACIPAGLIAAIGSTVECWLRTKKN